MIVLLFHNVVKMSDRMDASMALVYAGNGVQYFFRATAVLWVFGQVKTAAGDIRHLMVREIGLDRFYSDASLMTEVGIFLREVEDVAVSAGNYLYFTPSFLLSFYGVLITYLAVLIQSF